MHRAAEFREYFDVNLPVGVGICENAILTNTSVFGTEVIKYNKHNGENIPALNKQSTMP
jgi:hypothetical protein